MYILCVCQLIEDNSFGFIIASDKTLNVKLIVKQLEINHENNYI